MHCSLIPKRMKQYLTLIQSRYNRESAHFSMRFISSHCGHFSEPRYRNSNITAISASPDDRRSMWNFTFPIKSTVEREKQTWTLLEIVASQIQILDDIWLGRARLFHANMSTIIYRSRSRFGKRDALPCQHAVHTYAMHVAIYARRAVNRTCHFCGGLQYAIIRSKTDVERYATKTDPLRVALGVYLCTLHKLLSWYSYTVYTDIPGNLELLECLFVCSDSKLKLLYCWVLFAKLHYS